MMFTLEDLRVADWIVWLIYTIGITTFVTRSMWFAWLRVALLRRGSYAGYCGGCVGFWIGLAAAYQLPVGRGLLESMVLSALASMVLGYAFAGGDMPAGLMAQQLPREDDDA